MKILNGADIAEFVKERQLRQARNLRQSRGRVPHLAIVHTSTDPVILKYIELKKEYANDIEIEVSVHAVASDQVEQKIRDLNDDEKVCGIIVQLPLSDQSKTETVLNMVAPAKDVDGLAEVTNYDPATPTAINWLLSGYNIELRQKKIIIVGEGRLVGAPLARMWQQSGYEVTTIAKGGDISRLKHADIVVSATGQPGLITSEMIPIGCVAIDAGTADVDGQSKGDFSPEIYQREDLILTPRFGGVGPLTVSALFDNVLKACSSQAENKT